MEKATKRPNILIITSDQQRKDGMHSYNPCVDTPTLTSLAKDGTVYDRAYIAHPTCTPSRATILTGQFASRHGAYTIGTALSDSAPTFSGLLSEDGYETYFIGKPHFRQLSTKGSYEYHEKALDEKFWKEHRGDYFGFEHLSVYNGHTNYPFTAGMHYRLWLKEKGLSDSDISNYFDYQPSDHFRQHGEWRMPREHHPSVFTADCAVDYLNSHNDEKPFAMWVSFSDPHDPHVVPEPYASMYDPKTVNYMPYVEGEHDCRPACYNTLYHEGETALPFNDRFNVPSAPSAKLFADDDYYREITAVHHGMMKLLDEELGRIIDLLKQRGLYDNTLIIFTTDHGDYLGNHGFVYKGFPAFEEVYNVPFVVKTPYQKNTGNRSDALISHVDIAPTVLEAAGLAPCPDMQGVSQLNTFDGSDATRSELIIENRPIEKDFYQKMVVTDKYKLVVYQDSNDGELYNLKTDRDQYNNLWHAAEAVETKRELLFKIAEYYGEDVSPKTDIASLIAIISSQMHSEEPVQPRTSYS